MPHAAQQLPAFLAAPSKIGDEISVTGKWVPTKPGSLFRKSAESKEMLDEWEDIHSGARADTGVLSTEINHVVGEDAVLVHHVFENPTALVHYFSTTATNHMKALTAVAQPQTHIVRGARIPNQVRDAILAKGVPATFGELLFGYVKNEYRQPNPDTAIAVTAKWTGKSEVPTSLDDLKYWWQRVGTEAYDLEEGLLRGDLLLDVDLTVKLDRENVHGVAVQARIDRRPDVVLHENFLDLRDLHPESL